MKKARCNKNGSYGKKIIIFSEILILLMILSSTIAVAATESTAKPTELSKVKIEEANPDFAAVQVNMLSSQLEATNSNHKRGYRPGPVNPKHFSKISSTQSSLPAYYDLRILNRVTPVKDQGYSGSCWAFATYGSLESYLMPGQTLDFSENHLKNVLSNVAPAGFDFSEGGNMFMSTAYLARWSGPVGESDDPYSDKSAYDPAESEFTPQKHVQNVLFIPPKAKSMDNNKIKSAVKQYGALLISMYMDNDPSHYYYNPTTYSYLYNGSQAPNHEVAVVGWDDNFDKNKFAQVPPGNGAFIIKNSWGTSWGDNGYFYVSYYDTKLGYDENAIFTSENTDNYQEIYQYDPLGYTSAVGYQTDKGQPIHTAWGANIFTADANEVLRAVSFYTTDVNCNYQIYINNRAGSRPKSIIGVKPDLQGTFKDTGYHTVKLDRGVSLQAGQDFSIILKLTTPNYGYPIAIEMPFEGYSSKATASPGQSFISNNGKAWEDITSGFSNTNVCIKAFC